MTEQHHDKPVTEIQATAERLANAPTEEQPRALEELANTILEYFNHNSDSTATSELFSRELPDHTQRFVAGWLVWILAKSPSALRFGNTEGLAGSLFDRVFKNNVYEAIHVEPKTQTFEKIQALTGHFQYVERELDEMIRGTTDLEQLHDLQQGVMRVFGSKPSIPLLAPLFPRELIQKSRLNGLFRSIRDYVASTERDPIHKRDKALDACGDFANEARTYDTDTSDRILGGLADRLKSAVETHFDSLEAGKSPNLTFSPIAKKYPLETPLTTINFKIRIVNDGTGPARDVRLDEVVCDDCIRVENSSIELGTIQPRDSFVLDIVATVVTSSSRASLLARLSWSRPGGRSEEMHEVAIVAQRHDVDWDTVELTEPYSLQPVTSGDDLIGRKDELNLLVRLTNLQTVGSGFIYGQKRVGKTSLANAVAERLLSDQSTKWIVVSKGSGDYVTDDATTTLTNLGNVLVQAITENVPRLACLPPPNFENGLSPLSGFVDQALADKELRLLFILDEFDEIPPALFRRTDLSTSLFQPLRQISNKRGCGFLLVGGENMQRIVNLQGDRLNMFRPVEVDCFDKSVNWSDFAELIRKPVEGWLTISEAALDEVFESSAGNPYFAKLLATELFTYMVKNRYSDASEVDVKTAIDNALIAIRANSFTHFWTDGLVEAPDDMENRRIARRLVLVSVGRAFRKYSAASFNTIWEEFGETASLLIGRQIFRATLQDFVLRKILVEDEQGNITPKIPLFRSWLRDKGVAELLADSRELEFLKSQLEDEERMRVTDAEISSLCKTWTQFNYHGQSIEPTAVREWLGQFGSLEDRRLMFRLLSNVKTYGDNTVRTKMNVAFGIVKRHMTSFIGSGVRVRRDILVSSLDASAAKSGLTYCRLFANENQLSTDSVQPLEQLEGRFEKNHTYQRLVLIDDFAGSGRSLVAGLERHMHLLRKANSAGIRIILISLVGFVQARSRVVDFIEKSDLDAFVYFCDELGPEDSAFSEQSTVFPDPVERERAKHVAESKGVALEPKHSLGYANTQALLVFSQSCPNNSLPILWSRNDGWSPLFPRQ